VTNDELDGTRVLALMREIDSAASLLASGTELLGRLGEDVHDPSPVLATLAIGAEKLLKLNIGLYSLETSGRWPTAAVMQDRDRYHHNIARMYAETMRNVKVRLQEAPAAPGWKALASSYDVVASDALLGLVMSCLDRYAKMGRFYNLDQLSGKVDLDPSPHELWNQLELTAAAQDSALWESIGTAEYGTVGAPGIRRAIRRSISRWWSLNQRAWNLGVLGRRAQMWSLNLGNGLSPA
jgi:hypothetical protein